VRFAIWDHAGKGGYLHQQLLAAGHTTAETLADADVFLADCDWAWAHPRPELIAAAKEAGAKVVLYPHGGLPTVFVYDGLTVPDPLVDLRLEHGQGSIEAAAELALELAQEATGWLYSPTESFQAVDDPVKVLFAPQHPNMEMLLNGTNGHDPGPSANQAVYRDLLKLGFEVTVSVVGPLWRNGVYPHPRAKLASNHQMRFEQSWQLIQGMDVVIAAGTVAATAIASGKPTVMLGQSHYADYIEGVYVNPDHVEIYDPFFRYPLDATDNDLEDLILAACRGDSEAAKWRERHIGDDGTGLAVELIEGLLGEKVASVANVIIGGVTAKSSALGGE
jgi:hypothetical protein